MQYIKISLLIFTGLAFGNTKARLFNPKFSTSQIRAYYPELNINYTQNFKGELNVSKSNKKKTILKNSNPDVLYIVSSDNDKIVGIEKIENFSRELNFRKLSTLYYTKNGDSSVTELGKGVSLSIHLNGEYASFYHPVKKEIIIQGIKDFSVKKIKLKNVWNPYFYPTIIMNYSKDVIYNEYADDGKMRISKFNLRTNKKSILLRSKSIKRRFDFCIHHSNEMIYILNSSIDTLNSLPTFITTINGEQIYKTDYKITGKLICYKDSLFFSQEKTKITNDEEYKYTLRGYEFKNSKLLQLYTSQYQINLFKQGNTVYFHNNKNIYELYKK